MKRRSPITGGGGSSSDDIDVLRLGQAVAMLTSLLGRPRAVVVVITTWRTINVNKSTSYDTPKHLPTAYQGTHQSGERIHVAVRDSESEQITGLLQLHQERHVYGQTGGVLGVSLEDGRVQSHDCAVVAVIVEPLQPPAQRHAHPSYF